MKKTVQNGNTAVVVSLLIVSLGIVGLFGYYLKTNKTSEAPKKENVYNPSDNTNYIYQVSTETAQEKSIYKSIGMKITVNYPKKFQLDDQSVQLILSDNGKHIIISREGTQFTSLNDYLNNVEEKNNVTSISREELKIDNYIAIKRFSKIDTNDNNSTKSYHVLIESRIYSLSTISPELYSDLDQIAQSFKYTP